jgi:multimeric flavodoxin WrbA
MKDADGVILASPVYGFQVSGLFKMFIDRHSYIFHRPRFFRQKALLLTTAGMGGMKDVLDYLDLVARIWGFDVAARVGILTSATMDPLPAHRKKENEEKLQKAAAAFLAALQRGTRSRPGFMDVMFFHVGRAGTADTEELSPADSTYWTDQGWLQKGRRYYVDVPVNPVYHSMGTLVEWFLRRRFRKDRQTVS